MDAIWLTGAQWLAVLRIGLGLSERDDGADLGGRAVRDGRARLVAGRRAGVVLIGRLR
ncbi:hypothetical protein [Streptomyces phaeoluteigriseus]